MNHLRLVCDALVLLSKELLYVVKFWLTVWASRNLSVLEYDIWDFSLELWVASVRYESVTDVYRVPYHGGLSGSSRFLVPVVKDLNLELLVDSLTSKWVSVKLVLVYIAKWILVSSCD